MQIAKGYVVMIKMLIALSKQIEYLLGGGGGGGGG